ncbi:hypothetical protein HY642_06940 [Candidatus Woesearchaeota archaeon]|nr:hypothetical protein [Candidatus Woesearchaeota archaeon]
MKVKRRLTQAEEFEIMKMVLDKFLWIGTVLMGWGLYRSLTDETTTNGVWYMVAGAVVLLAFALIIVREFEQLR